MIRNALASALALTACCLPAAGIAADAWPSRPVRLIVPFPPGGAPIPSRDRCP